MSLADLEIASATQSEETIKKILESQGLVDVEIQQTTDQPADDKPPVVEPPATEAAATEEAPVVEAAPPVEESEEEKKKKESGSAREKRRRLEAESKLATLQAENERLSAELAGKPAPVVAPPVIEKTPAVEAAVTEEVIPDAKTKPTLESCDNDYERFQEELIDWKSDERERKQLIAAAERRKTEAADKIHKEHTAALERQTAAEKERSDLWAGQQTLSRAKHDDWDKTLKETQVSLSGPMDHLIVLMPDGGEVAYWLAKHPEEAQRIITETTLKEGYSTYESRKALATAFNELSTISSLIATETAGEPAGDEEGAGESEPLEEKPKQAATPPAPVTPPKKQPAAFTPKPEPPKPVGGRAVKNATSLADPAGLRALDADDYRRQREAGTLR